jgi:hypothetical protein
MDRMTFYLIWILLLTASCNAASDTKKAKYMISVNSAGLDTPFKLKIKSQTLHYIPLETNDSCRIRAISQIAINQDTIYILDKQRSALLLFNISGKFLTKFSFGREKLVNFDLSKNDVYILEKTDGLMHKITVRSRYIKTDTLGLHGVQFVALSGSRLLFNTAGLRTKDLHSEHYQLAEVNLNGQFLKMHLPFAPPYKAIHYYYPNQLTRSNVGLFFTSAFDNILYTSIQTKIVPYIKFDFGKYNLPDSVFTARKEADELGNLQYVTDLANIAQTNFYSFFNFTFKSETGYLLLRLKDKKVISVGVGSQANAGTGCINLVPAGSYKNEFFSIVEPETLIANMPGSPKLSEHERLQNLKGSDNPILMFYQL